jgi:hypothetical protein
MSQTIGPNKNEKEGSKQIVIKNQFKKGKKAIKH